MRKNILWAIRVGLSIRDMINNHGNNHFLLHVFSNGELVTDGTYVYDRDYKSLFKKKCKECERLIKLDASRGKDE